MKKTEVTLLFLSAVSGIWLYALLPGGEHMVMIVLTLLSLLYFAFGFLIFSNVGLRSALKSGLQGISAATTITNILTGLVASTLVIGVLFKIMILPGADQMLLIGVTATAVLFMLSVIRFMNNKNNITRFNLSRMTIFLVVGFILWSIPNVTMVAARYRNHPRYVEAYSNFVADPQNPDTWKALDLEDKRMYLSPESFKKYETNPEKVK